MNKYIHPLHQIPQRKQVQPKIQNEANLTFHDVLANTKNVQISKHAKERMISRGIELNEETLEKISNKMIEAKKKGVTDAVVILDDASFIVSIKNNTIITALNQDETSNQIFTNINGTIVI